MSGLARPCVRLRCLPPSGAPEAEAATVLVGEPDVDGEAVVEPLSLKGVPCAPVNDIAELAKVMGGKGVVAILAGTWLSGAALLGSFAAGTIPLYALLQTGMLKLQSRGPTPWLPRFQQALAFTAAALLVWRAMLPGHDCCH